MPIPAWIIADQIVITAIAAAYELLEDFALCMISVSSVIEVADARLYSTDWQISFSVS